MDVNTIDVRKYLTRRIREEPFIEIFEDEKQWLVNQMISTIETGESTSALIVDVTNSPSTKMVENAVQDIQSNFGAQCTIIQLYGLLHSAADSAFLEILENLNVGCYSDIEIMGAMADKVDYVLKCIRDENENKPIIFIFNEFHLFCKEGDNTLIYPLTDILHSKVPICVIGVTSDQTCIELLGKRVLSRFSGKVIYLESKNIMERNISAFRNLLSLDKSHFPEIFKEWNSNVLNLSTEPTVYGLIKCLSELVVSEKRFRDVLFSIACSVGAKKKHLTSEEVAERIKTYLPGKYPVVLESLSSIEFCLVIAILHHIDILREPIFNFKAIFQRYNKVKTRSKQIVQMSEQQGKKAFETLMLLGLIKPVQSHHSELMEYIPCRFRPVVSVAKDFIENSNNVSDFLKQWMKNPLICQ